MEHQSVDQKSRLKKHRWNASQLDLANMGVPPDNEKVVEPTNNSITRELNNDFFSSVMPDSQKKALCHREFINLSTQLFYIFRR